MANESFGDLVSVLAQMSVENLTALKKAISSDVKRRHLLKLIDSMCSFNLPDTHELAQGKEAVLFEDKLPSELFQHVLVPHLASSSPTVVDERGVFFKLFEDRSLFPTLKKVVTVLNKAIGCRYKAEEFRHGGRSALLTDAWMKVEGLSWRDRRDVMLMIAKLSLPPHTHIDADYQRLFNILVRDDRGT